MSLVSSSSDDESSESSEDEITALKEDFGKEEIVLIYHYV